MMPTAGFGPLPRGMELPSSLTLTPVMTPPEDDASGFVSAEQTHGPEINEPTVAAVENAIPTFARKND